MLVHRVAADAGSWIRPRLTGPWGSVTGVVPDGYEAYVRILHPVEHGEHVLRWSDVAAVTGRRMHPLVQWWRLVDADEALNPISDLFNGDPPHTGELILPAANALFATLTLHTANPDASYFGFWTGYSGDNGAHTWPTAVHDLHLGARGARAPALALADELELPGREYALVLGSLDTATHIIEHLDCSARGPTSANLMWPSDRQWFVASEIDFDSTLIACDTDTAHALTTHGDLEAYRVGPHDSLQSDADTLNPQL